MTFTKAEPPESDRPSDDLLDAGLSAAFSSDSEALDVNGGCGLRSLSSLYDSRPRVTLPDSSEDDKPVVKSAEVPWNEDPSGRYELLGEIGHGAMGTVFWGRDTELGRELAVKVLREKYRYKRGALERFVEEAEIAAQLQHPGIMPIYELGEFDDGRPYITMKLVKGKTLSRLLRECREPSKDCQGNEFSLSDGQHPGCCAQPECSTGNCYLSHPQDRPRFLGIFEQVCQTLAYAHARGVIHRDLKPGNVMVGSFGEVQVMDWGLAKVLTQPGSDSDRPCQSRQPVAGATSRSAATNGDTADSTPLATHAGTVLGTPAYISPEQARGDIERTDKRSDVFGLGAILCEILTGAPPYVGDNVRHQAENAELADALRRLDLCEVDDKLIALAKWCLAPDPEDRPRHAGLLAEELAGYLASVENRLRQAELENARDRDKATHEQKMHRMTLTLAATILLFGGLAATGWFWVQQHEHNRVTETNRRLRAELKKEKENTALTVLNLFAGKDISSDKILPNIERIASTSLVDSPIDEAMLRQTMSSFYLSIGEFELARVHAERAVEILRKHAGPERPVTLAAQDHLKRVRDLCFPDPVPRGEIDSAANSSPDETLTFNASYASAVLADSPVGYWRLNEAAREQIVRDASPRANHFLYHGTSATAHGATSFQAGGFGTTDFVKGSMFHFPSSKVSIEFWLQTTANNGFDTVVSYAAIDNRNDNELMIHNAGNITLVVDRTWENSGISVNDGKWHHVVVTWKSSDGEVVVYKDGSMEFSGTLQPGKIIHERGFLVFGQDQDAVGGKFEPGDSYQGLLAEVAIYDTVLSSEQVAAHYVAMTNKRPRNNVASVPGDFSDWNTHHHSTTYNSVEVTITGDLEKHGATSVRNTSDEMLTFSFDQPIESFTARFSRVADDESIKNFNIAPSGVNGALVASGSPITSVSGVNPGDNNTGTVVWTGLNTSKIEFAMGFGGAVVLESITCSRAMQ